MRGSLPVPVAGETYRSRDPRDNGLVVTVLDVWADSSHKWVRIQRFRKTNVSLRRFHRDYERVPEGDVVRRAERSC